MTASLVMSSKFVIPGVLEIKVVWNKVYDVLIPAHDIINKILSRDSNYIVDVVMGPKFVWDKFINSILNWMSKSFEDYFLLLEKLLRENW